MPANPLPASLLDQAAVAVSRFGRAATAKLRSGAGGPEDQLRAPTERLFEDIAAALGVTVTMIGETSLGVRPDYAADVLGARVGYVELKAPGRGVPSTWTPNKHEREQWEKTPCCALALEEPVPFACAGRFSDPQADSARQHPSMAATAGTPRVSRTRSC